MFTNGYNKDFVVNDVRTASMFMQNIYKVYQLVGFHPDDPINTILEEGDIIEKINGEKIVVDIDFLSWFDSNMEKCFEYLGDEIYSIGEESLHGELDRQRQTNNTQEQIAKEKLIAVDYIKRNRMQRASGLSRFMDMKTMKPLAQPRKAKNTTTEIYYVGILNENVVDTSLNYQTIRTKYPSANVYRVGILPGGKHVYAETEYIA